MVLGMTWTREQALAELDFLATVEHALLVEYQWIFCALGHDIDGVDPRVHDAAQVVSGMSVDAMRQLRRINNALASAEQSAQTDRASALPAEGGPVTFGPLSRDQLDQLVARASTVAYAVDARYERLRPTVEPPTAVLEDGLREQVASIVEFGTAHKSSLDSFVSGLRDVPASVYLLASRYEPADDLERFLLDLSDRYYQLIMNAVRMSFAVPGDFGFGGGELLQRAVSAMLSLNDVNRLLVQRGLLPAFTVS